MCFKKTIEPPLLKQISNALKVRVEALQNFDEEQIVNLISNTASFENCQQPAFFNYQPSFNPIDKMIELYESMASAAKRNDGAARETHNGKIGLLYHFCIFIKIQNLLQRRKLRAKSSFKT